LSAQARTILSDPANLIVVPSIVILEIKYLYRRKRIPLPFEDGVGHMEATPNVLFYPLELSVVSLAPASLDIHDAIIVGTALHLSNELNQPVSLVTADRTICDSGLVPVIW